MGIDVEKERRRLGQRDFLEKYQGLGATDMVAVYLDDDENLENPDGYGRNVFCQLVPQANVREIMENPNRDLPCHGGLAGQVEYMTGTWERRMEYKRFGRLDGLEPLVYCRYFEELKPGYVELGEEFRHFHNLYDDRKDDVYVKFDDAGQKTVVARIRANHVEIRMLEIRQFLAVKKMCLIISFRSTENSQLPLAALGLINEAIRERGESSCVEMVYGEMTPPIVRYSYSDVVGKWLIRPLDDRPNVASPSEEEADKTVDFVIGIDESGREVLHSSDPGSLADYFGGNRGEPHYLTPVYFRREVLEKYYHHPSKYAVEASGLRCGMLWHMCMDNHQADVVVAWLGDLGRDIPYQERLHWRSYNIPPSGQPSETFVEQQILALPSESKSADHVFKCAYRDLKTRSERSLGWHVVLPLETDDQHHLAGIRLLANDEQKTFEEQMSSLAKVLVDSLNCEVLGQFVPATLQEGVRGAGIAALERALEGLGVKGYEGHVRFLRDLQSVRSTGLAHRKGSNYKKLAQRLRFHSRPLREVFEEFMVKGTEFLRFVSKLIADGVLPPRGANK